MDGELKMFGKKKELFDSAELMKNAVLTDDIERLKSMAYTYSVLKSADLELDVMQESMKLLAVRIEGSLKI